jgi:hypothetical protein
MYKLLTIGFEFLEDFYYSLIKVNEKDGHTEYQVTVMNGKLEKMFHAGNIFNEINGYLQVDLHGDKEHEKFILRIAEALSDFLKIPLSVEKNSLSG